MSNNSLKYTIGNQSCFANAEPYHYGSGSPPVGYFLPIGEDDLSNTEDFKIQCAETNGYSSVKELKTFQIKGNPITYIETGTFPLMKLIKAFENPYVSQKHNKEGTDEEVTAENGEADSHDVACTLVVTYDTDNQEEITSITFNYWHNNPSKPTDSLEIYNKKDNKKAFVPHANEEYPKRLGFILTGGGGGAGGVSRIDPKSDGKENDFITPGGGGGGAETICGVFDLTRPTWLPKNESLIYWIKLGNGGKGGEHNIKDASYDSPKFGTNGEDGVDSYITVYRKDLTPTKYEELYRACGGFGGKCGGKTAAGEPGNGGSYSNKETPYPLYTSNQGVTLCMQVKGGKGGYQVTESSLENESLSATLYFGKVKPDNDPNFCYELKHDSIITTHNAKSISTDVNVAGGHSFGAGGTKGTNPCRGAGGACNGSGGRDGAGAYFGLYY